MNTDTKLDDRADLLRLLENHDVRIEGAIRERKKLSQTILAGNATVNSYSCRVTKSGEICEIFDVVFSDTEKKRFSLFRKPRVSQSRKKKKKKKQNLDVEFATSIEPSQELRVESPKPKLPKSAKTKPPRKIYKKRSVWMQFTGGFETNRSRH